MAPHRILVVDDDPAVGATTGRLIAVAGYRSIYRNTADAALACLEDHAGDVLAVLTDLHMVGMDGIALAESIVSRWPDVPVIICTGGSGPGAESLIERPGVRGVLGKPIRLQQLNSIFSSLGLPAAGEAREP